MSDSTQKTSTLVRAGLSLAALVALTTGTWIGCSKQPMRLISPAVEADVKEFPLPSAASGVAGLKTPAEIERDANELAVTRVDPVGNQAWKGAVTVVFNHAMTAPSFGSKIKEVPFSIEPAVAGEFVWWGERTLVFKPNAPLPPATRFTVTVPKDTASLDGKKLTKDYTFGFETPGLKITSLRAQPNRSGIGPGTTFTVNFNLPVKLDDVRANTMLTPDRGAKVELEVEPVSYTRGSEKVVSETTFNIRPKSKIEPGRTYVMQVAGDISPKAGGKVMGTPRIRSWKSFTPLRVVSVRCGWGEMCRPGDRIDVEFSNPIDPKVVKACVSVSGGIKTELGYSYGRRVSLNPQNFESGKKFNVSVRGSCKDRFGTKLSNSMTRSYTVSDQYPYLSMRRGFATLEPGEPGDANVVPVTAMNQGELMLRMYEVPADELLEFVTTLSEWDTPDLFKGGKRKPSVVRPVNKREKRNKAATFGVELNDVLGKKTSGIVYLDLQQRASSSGSRDERPSDWAMVSLTDLGVTIKSSPSQTMVWVTSLSEASPVGAATAKLFSESGEVLWTGTTDAEGLASGPGRLEWEGRGASSRPRLLVVQSGQDATFVDLDEYATKYSTYGFDVAYDWDAKEAEVIGHLFTERGVYRPGDSVSLKGLLRLRRGTELETISSGRVNVVVNDSRGNEIMREDVDVTDLGGFHVSIPTEKDASLGYYSITVRPEGLDDLGDEGTVNSGFRVEAYRAPRFEVNVRPLAKDAIVGDRVDVQVEGRYLFGAPMLNAPVYYSATVREGSFRAPKFKEFTFGRRRSWWWYEDSYDDDYGSTLVSEADNLGDDGTLSFAFETSAEDGKATGPRSVRLEAEVTDVDSQVVSSTASMLVHPASYYVGVRHPGYLVESGKAFQVPVIAVTPDGKVRAGAKVAVEINRREWVSVQKKTVGGGLTWVSERRDSKVGSCATTTKQEPVACDFEAAKPGYYTIEATSKDSKGRKVRSTESFYVWGKGGAWWRTGDDEQVQLVPDKDDYKVGDVARVLVQSPFKTAKALVTIEREGVISSEVLTLDESTSTLEIPVTEQMVPNAFVSVALVRGRLKDVKAKKGSLLDPGKPAYKLGYLPLEVDTSGRALDVRIDAAKDTYSPGEEVSFDVALTGADGKPTAGEVTFMAVDEGVLSLTNYQTPNPLKIFYKDRALAVNTHESRMKLISKVQLEASGGLKGEPGGGGDEERSMMADGGMRKNFVTTAAFMPLVKVDASGVGTVSFTLPDNLTSYRLMAVAVASGDRFGKTDRRITVNKPLLVRPALPRFASTGDDFGLRAVVQSLGSFSGDVEVRARVEGPLELDGSSVQAMALGNGEAKTVVFPVRAGDPGEATVTFEVVAKNGDGKDGVQVKLPVKYPAVERQLMEVGQLDDETKVLWRRLRLPEGAHPGAGQLEVELASSQFSKLLPSLNYLIDYPYGCVEQTTGRTLPMVALEDTLKEYDIAGVPTGKMPEFIQAGVDRLFSMQTREGGLGYWPGASRNHLWGSAYGGLAIVMAKKRGYTVDEQRYELLLGYLRSMLDGTKSLNAESYWHEESKVATSALAAYALAVAGKSEDSFHELLFEAREDLPRWSKALLMMAIHEAKEGAPLSEARQKMMRTLYDELVAGVVVTSGEAHMPKGEDDYYWMTMSSQVRSDALALQAILRVDYGGDLRDQFARGLLEARRGGRWVSTQSNAFALMSLAEYFDTVEGVAPSYDVAVGLGDDLVATESFRGRALGHKRVVIPMRDVASNEGKLLTLQRSGSGGPLYFTLKLKYADANPPKTERHGGFSLRREYFYTEGDEAGKRVEGVELGQVVQVRLTIVVPEERHYVAIEDPMPAGFEAINTSFSTTSRRIAELNSSDSKMRDDWYWSRWWWRPSFDYTEQRDDKVLLFANKLPQGVYSHSYLVRATTPGTFTAPAARVEEMYHPNVDAMSSARVFTVEAK